MLATLIEWSRSIHREQFRLFFSVWGAAVAAGALVSVAVSPGNVSEAANLIYTFSRSDTTGQLTVDFTVLGPAVFGADYT